MKEEQGGEEDADVRIFDPDAFRQRIGDEMLMCELIRIFEEELAQMWQSLLDAERKGDVVKVHEAAHRLKGLVGNYCASRAWDCVTKLNGLAAAGDLAAASKIVTDFEKELGLLEDALREFRKLLEVALQSA